MPKIIYKVIVTINSSSKAQEWLDWLNEGHIDEVIAGGASNAQIIKLEPENEDSGPVTYEILYTFDNRGIFESYIDEHAPRLRQEGLSLFPLEDGFHYKRAFGELIES